MNLCHLCLLFSVSPFLKLPAWDYSCHVSLHHISYLSSFHPHTHLLYSTKKHCSAALWSNVVTSPRLSKEYWNAAEYRTMWCCQTFTKKYARWNDCRWCLYAVLAVSGKSSALPSQWVCCLALNYFQRKMSEKQSCFLERDERLKSISWNDVHVWWFSTSGVSLHLTELLRYRLPSHECKSLNSIWHHLLRRLKQMRQWVACLW